MSLSFEPVFVDAVRTLLTALSAAMAPALIAAVVTAMAIPAATRLLQPAGFRAAPAGDLDVHRTPVPRLGGVGIMVALAALAPWLSSTSPPAGPSPAGAVAVLAAMFLLGLADDRFDLSPVLRLVAQFAIALGAAVHGFRPDIHPALGVPLGAVTIVMCANALNWLDGIDGLAGGVAAIATSCFATAMAAAGLPSWGHLNAAAAGALVAFLAFNFSGGRSKVFLGDCGSMACGTLMALSAWTLTNSQRASFLVPWAIVAVPVLELVSTILRRAVMRQPLLRGDRNHTYDLLLRHGWRSSIVLILFYCTTATAGAIAILGLLER